MKRFLLPILCALPLAAALPSQDEALALAFPGAALTRREHTLTPDQATRVKTLSGRELSGTWFVAFEARRGGKLEGVAFFDTHRVRTQPETAMVAVGPDGRILRVEVVAFKEPQEYMARGAWIRQMDHRALDNDLAVGHAIKPLGGATLTATALTDAARRGIALFQVLYGGAK